jgi:hypothetical protein
MEDVMRRCNGRLFDGSACNNHVVECDDCNAAGCHGDGCDSQLFIGETCDCGSALPQLIASHGMMAR